MATTQSPIMVIPHKSMRIIPAYLDARLVRSKRRESLSREAFANRFNERANALNMLLWKDVECR